MRVIAAALPLPLLSTLQLLDGVFYSAPLVHRCRNLTALSLDPYHVPCDNSVPWELVTRVSFATAMSLFPAELPSLTHLSFDMQTLTSPVATLMAIAEQFTNLRRLTFYSVSSMNMSPRPPLPSLTALTIAELRPSLCLTLAFVMKKVSSVRRIALGLKVCDMRSYEAEEGTLWCALQRMEEVGVESVALYEVGSHRQRLRELRGILKGWMQLVVTDQAMSGPFPE